MRTAFCLLLIILIAPAVSSAQSNSVYKSEAEIARMTPDQRVEELCDEHARHVFIAYDAILKNYLRQDGLKVMPQVIREIEAYDPTRREGASQEKFRRYEAAAFILSHFEHFLFRVRAFAEGREAIEALKQLSERLRIARSKSKDKDEFEMKRRYELNLSYVERLEGICTSDRAIQDTLEFKYDIHLSNEELVAFVNYLVSHNPSYPSWSESKMYKEDPRNPYSRWLRIYKDPEPYRQAYLEYKAKKPEPK